jgi:hypothetical protein
MYNKEQLPMGNRVLSSQILVGLILILVGLAILSANLGWADLSGIFQWIPSLFILLGVWQLIANRFRFITGPIILIAGGAAFQLAAFDIIDSAVRAAACASTFVPDFAAASAFLIAVRTAALAERFASRRLRL